ncbi:uncharacterized protein LOC134207526 [Armigeres subalbatus]|uniref:uncharacterized protein LOC134207526 n=1 Tax=Armigeres subalbatus TaxID=124917 RepID=UPI002ED00136
MYRQVNVHEEDSWLQCILWRNHPSEEIQTYRLKTVTYGEAAWSFLACRALHEVGEELCPEQPEIADAIQQCFYVDNLMMGGDSVDELLHRRKAVEAALLKKGFPLRKWASNDPTAIRDVATEDVEQVIHVGDHDVIKTLGVAWYPQTDTFRFLVDDQDPRKTTMTKRQLASEILRLYDPLGIMQPIIITAKILLQGLWKIKLKWDDQIPAQSHHEWQQLKNTLPKLASLAIPRQAIPSNAVHLELHGFSDASILVYGCAIYAYCIDDQNWKTTMRQVPRSTNGKGQSAGPDATSKGTLSYLPNQCISELEAGERLIVKHEVKHLQQIHYRQEFAHLEEKGTPIKQGPLQQ